MLKDRGLDNRWIDLRLWPGRPLAGGGPFWAALCGLIASGGLAADANLALKIGFTLFLAGPIWGALWQVLAAADWFTPFLAREWAISAPWVMPLPYTGPDSPAGHVAESLGRIRVWWSERFWPRYGPDALGLFVALPLSLGVALVLGRPAVVLTVAVWTLATLAQLVDRGAGTPPIELQAMVESGLPWLLGHALLRDLTWLSVAMSLLFTITCSASLLLARSKHRPLAWLNGGQGAAIILLILDNQFLFAAAIALLFLSQLYLQSFLHRDGDARCYLGQAQPFLMASMLLTAIAVT